MCAVCVPPAGDVVFMPGGHGLHMMVLCRSWYVGLGASSDSFSNARCRVCRPHLSPHHGVSVIRRHGPWGVQGANLTPSEQQAVSVNKIYGGYTGKKQLTNKQSKQTNKQSISHSSQYSTYKT